MEMVEKMSRILVLGSSGQIGAPLVEYLRSKGHGVVCCDIKSSVAQDLRSNPLFLREYFEGIDFCYFMAFDVGGSRYLRSYEHSYEFLENNTKIMQNVFGFLRQYKIPFVFASSQMAAYPFSSYGNLKLLGEKYTTALGGVSARFWNVYGLETDPEKFHVITDIVSKVLRGERTIKLMSDGLEARQFLFVEDACAALEQMMLHRRELDREVQHVSSCVWLTIRGVAECIKVAFEQRGIKIDIEFENAKDEVHKGRLVSPEKTGIYRYWTSVFPLQRGIEWIIDKMTPSSI
jgi:nucleoside-diphosphate-sugar epimerase